MKTVNMMFDVLKNYSEEINLKLNKTTGKIEISLSNNDDQLKKELEKAINDEVHGYESDVIYE